MRWPTPPIAHPIASSTRFRLSRRLAAYVQIRESTDTVIAVSAARLRRAMR